MKYLMLDEYYEKLEDYEEKRIAKTPNDVYLEVVGGIMKGKVHGLGNASQMYFKNYFPSHSSTSSSTPSMTSQLCSQIGRTQKDG